MSANPAGDLLGLVLSTTEAQITQANDLAAKVQAATTDQGKLVHDIINEDNSQDETIRKFQEWLAKIDEKREQEMSKIREYVKANRLNSGEAIDVDATKEQYKALAGSVKQGLGYLKTVGATDEQIAALPALKTIRGTAASTGASGDGPKRPRISHATVNGTDIWGEKKDPKTGETTQAISFTILGAEMTKIAKGKVDPKDLRAAVYQAAGTEDLTDESLKGKTFTFSHSVNDTNYEVAVTI